MGEEDKLNSKINIDFVKGKLIAKENTQESFEKQDIPPLAITAPSYASIAEKKGQVSVDDTKFSSPMDVIVLPSQKRSTIIITNEYENKRETEEEVGATDDSTRKRGQQEVSGINDPS